MNASEPSRNEFGGVVGRTLAESKQWWRRPNAARPGSPNIVVVLVDDLGYSDLGPYGSEIETPVVDRVRAEGYCLTNFHATPSRAALLTGVNAHRVGFGTYVESGFPGYSMQWRDDTPTLAESLRAGGYANFAVGKWHLSGRRSSHEAAPRDDWPLQRGFDRFYQSLEGMTNLFHPHQLIVDNSPVQIDRYPDDYFLTNDLTGHAIGMIKGLRAHDAKKPFFLYLAHFAVHGPLHAPAEATARFEGRFDDGWDRLREERFRRQIASGLFPVGTVLPPRNKETGHEVEAWVQLPADSKPRLARYMEVYAASVANIDKDLGRLLDTLDALGELDNTVVVVSSDNGGTMEGGPEGTRSYFSQIAATAAFSMDPGRSPLLPLKMPRGWEGDYDHEIGEIGGPRTMVHYPRGWGMVSNTPFRLYKGHAFAGGIRVPFIVSWPQGLPRAGGDDGLRRQYQYVTDATPTLLQPAGVPPIEERNGVPATGFDGASFVPILCSVEAESSHTEQYIEHGGHRGYYRAGWKLVTLHAPGVPYDDGEWELYDVERDPTETTNLADDEPELLRELASAWEAAAAENFVFPLQDGHPVDPEEHDLGPVTLLPGTPTLERHRSSVLIHLRSFRIEFDFQHGQGDQGVLLAHGDQGGGYSVYVEGDRLICAYNEYGMMHGIPGGRPRPGEGTGDPCRRGRRTVSLEPVSPGGRRGGRPTRRRGDAPGHRSLDGDQRGNRPWWPRLVGSVHQTGSLSVHPGVCCRLPISRANVVPTTQLPPWQSRRWRSTSMSEPYHLVRTFGRLSGW